MLCTLSGAHGSPSPWQAKSQTSTPTGELSKICTEAPKPSWHPVQANFEVTFQVPVARSKLHGHRGVAAYHPKHVEYVPLDAPYYHYPVSCATEAQARGIRQAFSRSQALLNPDDPRQIVFTVLPGHGVVMVEKWQPGKDPFQLIWEYMDAGYLEIEAPVPQGWYSFEPGPDGRRHLQIPE